MDAGSGGDGGATGFGTSTGLSTRVRTITAPARVGVAKTPR